MIWLEMSRDDEHGGGHWGFPQCLWSPALKQNGSKWGYWETLTRVQADDLILHLRGQGPSAALVGYSTAALDGFVTRERPPNPEPYGWSTSFFKVLLEDFTAFENPVSLQSIFSSKNEILTNYYEVNKTRGRRERRLLFYVIQRGRLQCLNGAYLTEVDEELGELLIGHRFGLSASDEEVDASTPTDENTRKFVARVGQRKFSENVRENYGHRCCFPQCQVSESQFLVGAHIARWVDVPSLRGRTDNGLCLCLIHDKAFEIGMYTLDASGTVVINPKYQTSAPNSLFQTSIYPFNGHEAELGSIRPSGTALRHHWERIQVSPSG
jgi:hypothetical protein